LNKYTFIIGAHKTGTTFANKVLLHNREALNSSKVWFEASSAVKHKLTRFLSKDLTEKILKETREYINSREKQYDRVIFSHENISGTIPSFVNSRSFYPNIGERVSSLENIMDGKNADIIFFIRQYDDHIISCYSEYIRSAGFVSFRKFYNRAFEKQPSWVKVIETVQSNYPNASLRVFDHKDFYSRPTGVLQEIIGKPILRLEIPETIYARPAISQTGVNVINLLAYHGYKDLDPSLIDQLAKILPKNKVFGALDELPAELKLKHKECYERDKKILVQEGILY